MLRHKIKLSTTGDDAVINIDLKSQYNLSGLDQNVETLIENETEISINDTSDGDKTRFTPSTTNTLEAFFYRNSTSSYVTNVAPNEFASTAITTQAFNNSFYSYDMYDSINENVQLLLHNGYINGSNFNGYTSIYTVNNNFEYGDVHIPNTFLENLTGSSFTLYMKLNFYSGKSGKVYPFSRLNPLTTNPFTEASIYNAVTFNITTKKYTVTIPFSFYEITNPAYVTAINQNVESLAVEKPTYPTGNTFTLDGKYVTVG